MLRKAQVALQARYRALASTYRAVASRIGSPSTIAADHMRLSAWAMGLPSSGLVLIRDGKIAIANQAFEELARLVAGPFVPHAPSSALAGDPARRLLTLRDIATAEAPGEWSGPAAPEHRRYRALGEERWIEVLFDRVRPARAPAVMVALFRDVTAQVKAEIELEAAQDALARQQHMRAIGELTAGIVHDLSNTLGAIRLRLSALRRDPVCMGAQPSNIEALERIVSDGTVMLQRLQRLGQSDAVQIPEPVDLVETIKSAIEIAQSGLRYRAIHDGVDIRIEQQLPALPRIVAWPDELQRVFVNLLINARDAMMLGGRIRLRGAVLAEQIAIYIEDEGSGIAPAVLPRIFEPYFTTKGSNGTGMGLATAQRAMARLGGRISAANRPEGGAIFTLSFPLRPGKAG